MRYGIADTMDKWDQAKLDRVVLSKAGNAKSTTDKVCKVSCFYELELSERMRLTLGRFI